MKQMALPIVTRPEPTFDSFTPGANALALAHLAALRPGADAAPVYLWGESGSGKSHLLAALTARFCELGAQVARFAASDPAPWPANEPAPALIVLDGCEAFDAAQQHAAFTLFVENAGQPCLIVAAGRLPPIDLPLRDDLRTRLGWGPVLALAPLSEADTLSTLRAAALARGLAPSDEVIHYLMTRYERDLKHQIGLLDRLDAFALETQRAITLPMLRAMLAESGSVP